MELKFYWAVTIVLGVSAVVVLLVGWIGCDRGIHPEGDPEEYDLSQFDLPRPENVHFESRDGLRLAGWFLPGTNGTTVLLAHGRGSEHSHMLSDANYLYQNGYSVLLFDFRYRGQSEGNAQTLGAKEVWDIESAVDYLKARPGVDPERIGVQGNSMGAATAILAAAERSEIKGVIADIPFTSINGILNHTFEKEFHLPSFPFALVTKWISEFRLGVDLDRVAPIEVIGTISPRPVFLIDHSEDKLFPANSVELLYEAANEPKTFWQIPGAPHGSGWAFAPEEYERRVLAFWRKTFGIAQP